MNKSPKVSVVSIAYNQEKYIKQTLEGFIGQRTDFDFEIVIADDCSTDSTASIIKKYADMYPKLFKAVFRKKNIGAVANFKATLQAASGDYIALCEGDDYWTDPYKLQRQADFLDRNQEFAICFHPVRVFFEGEPGDYIYPDPKEAKDFSEKKLLQSNFIQTNSAMYRKQNYQQIPLDILPLDWYLHLYHAQFGKIGYINEVMSAYRRHKAGLWWGSQNDDNSLLEKHGHAHIRFYAEAMKLYGKSSEYRKIIVRHVATILPKLIQVDKKRRNDKLLHEVLKEFSDEIEPLVTALEENSKNTIDAQKVHMQEQLKVIEHLTSERDDLQRRFDHSMQELDKVNKEYERVRKSVAWRAMNRLPTRKRNKQA